MGFLFDHLDNLIHIILHNQVLIILKAEIKAFVFPEFSHELLK